jgi:hypothetical protein
VLEVAHAALKFHAAKNEPLHPQAIQKLDDIVEFYTEIKREYE